MTKMTQTVPIVKLMKEQFIEKLKSVLNIEEETANTKENGFSFFIKNDIDKRWFSMHLLHKRSGFTYSIAVWNDFEYATSHNPAVATKAKLLFTAVSSDVNELILKITSYLKEGK